MIVFKRGQNRKGRETQMEWPDDKYFPSTASFPGLDCVNTFKATGFDVVPYYIYHKL